MKASSKLWMKLQLTWQQCSSLPVKCWATSVAAFDGNVYVVANHGTKLPISLIMSMTLTITNGHYYQILHTEVLV